MIDSCHLNVPELLEESNKAQAGSVHLRQIAQNRESQSPVTGNSQTSPIHNREDRHETPFAYHIDQSELKSLH